MGFVLALLSGFGRLLGPLLTQFLFSLGVGAVTYTGVKALIDYAEGQVHSQLGGLASGIVELLSACKVDQAISIIFGAVAVRLALQGMTAAGSITKFRLGSSS